ncbi:MAG: peptidoglycan DD-metalloendopeptidase family protein [Clostridiales bacterium]|nr:peptidoglycan DD-metalloendopeptidase family protein [Clostridiales bacterium]
MDSRDKQSRKVEEKTEEAKRVEVYVERGEAPQDDYDLELMKEAAAVYARYLKDKGLEPGAATFIEPEQLNVNLKTTEVEYKEPEVEEPEAQAGGDLRSEKDVEEHPERIIKEQPNKEKKVKAEKKRKKEKSVKNTKEKIKRKKPKKERNEKLQKEGILVEKILSAPIDMHDKLQVKLDGVISRFARDFITETHNIISIYKNSKKVIGRGVLVMGLICAFILVLFDNYTVYEYAYNGKVLGYVDSQEDVTDILDITGEKLSEARENEKEVKFEANENITFNLVDGREKSTDDSDTAVNKLIYMTDIETEAFGIYDGGNLVTIVESKVAAEKLLGQAMNILSTPDTGMELLEAEFSNSLDIQPINVLLFSVQSNNKAKKQMTKGGEAEFYHIVEEGESLDSLETTFGVNAANIYDGENKEAVSFVEQGDKVCIRKDIKPVSIKMVESGKMREKIEYETIKKKSKEYYKGDTHVEQKGIDGIQIFEGTLTKVGGEITDRKTDNIEIIREKQDKIILIGTAKRPKTAPTGTFAMPVKSYVLSSYFGPRWGRMHTGIDMANSMGTPIYASDGGTVIRAEDYGGYGLCIDIDHENGRVTRYGHCSALLVNAGDKVYQGQNIALMGNTGRSFGSHLHFEIILNGSPVDPLPLLGL